MNDHVRSSAFLKAEQIRQQASRLKVLPFPSRIPALFATFICSLCERLKERVSSEDAGERVTTLIAIFLVDRIAPTLEFIESASSENTPASLVVPVEKIGEKVLAGSRFIVGRQWPYNYSEREPRAGLEENLEGLLSENERKELFKNLPPKLFVISFPSFERDNALLHVNFAHEIAHPLEQQYLKTEDQPKILRELREGLRKEIEAGQPDPLQRAMAIGAAVGDAERKRKAALMEILSATISARVFRLSALFALHEVAAFSTSMDKISADLHPPWRSRLREVFTTLEQLGFVDPKSFQLLGWPAELPEYVAGIKSKVDDRLLQLHQMVEQTTDIAGLQKRPSDKQAYDSAKRAFQNVRKFAAEKVPAQYTPKLFSEEVPDLLERRHADLPPNRIELSLCNNRPVNLASILASGWLFKVGEPVFGHDRPDDIERTQKLNRLVLKAIELSEIQTEYAGWAKRQDHGTPNQA
jgi:hypothetical protein